MSILMLAALSSCGSFEDQAIGSAEEAVKSQLKDPTSAVFEDVHLVYGRSISKGNREMYACGYVNARNSYAAMAGRVRFVVLQYEAKLNGKRYYSTYEAKVEDQLEDAKYDGTPASFDRLYWVHCR